eukprot:8288262-Pyramimonas_sp.AAC.1
MYTFQFPIFGSLRSHVGRLEASMAERATNVTPRRRATKFRRPTPPPRTRMSDQSHPTGINSNQQGHFSTGQQNNWHQLLPVILCRQWNSMCGTLNMI